jgi:serine protease Do
MKKTDNDRILIKKKHKVFNFTAFSKVGICITIVIIGALITSKVAINNAIKNIENSMVNSSLEQNEEVQKKYYDGIMEVSSSLVTISDDQTKLDKNNFEEGNVTGIVFDKKGYILTSYTKIKNMKKVYIKLPAVAKKPIEGTIIGIEELTDIAIIKIESDGLTPINTAEDDAIKAGYKVLAVGNAVSDDFIGIVTDGIVTSINETITLKHDMGIYRLIQTNAIINSQNIGGALCNINGELVGFNSNTLGRKDDISLYYTLEAKGVKSICEYLISLTDILGINGGNVIDDRQTGVQGVYIENIKPEGSAAKAGMLPTDIIVGIDDNVIKTPEEIYYAIKDKKSGDTIICDFLRDGSRTRVEISLN